MAEETGEPVNAQLGEFVTEALVQIATGIRNANVRAATTSVPRLWKKLDEPQLIGVPHEQLIAFALAYGNSQEEGAGIHFDIAVSAETTKEGSGGAKFAIGVVGIGGEGSASTQQSRVSRVQFSVQVTDRISVQYEASGPEPEPLPDS